MILNDEEIRGISNRVPPHPYLDIPFQYVELGAKAQLKKVVDRIKLSPVFLKNCKSNRKRSCKICQECPFDELIEQALLKETQ